MVCLSFSNIYALYSGSRIHYYSYNWHQRAIVLGASTQDEISPRGAVAWSVEISMRGNWNGKVRNSASWYISVVSSWDMFSTAIAVGSMTSQPRSNHLLARLTHTAYHGHLRWQVCFDERAMVIRRALMNGVYMSRAW
jgi:hypothetical protein